MRKLDRAWVTTNTRADGKKFYTAYIRFKDYIFWFVPVYYVYPVWKDVHNTSTGQETVIYSTVSEYYDPYKFNNKDEAETALLELIDKHLDEVQEAKDKKVVKQEYTPVSFGSID